MTQGVKMSSGAGDVGLACAARTYKEWVPTVDNATTYTVAVLN